MHFLRNSEGFEKYLQYLIGKLQAESVISEKEVHQYFKVGLQNIDRIVIYFWGISFLSLKSSAVKRLIAINCIQNKRFCLHNIYVCTVYIYHVYINIHTHACVYTYKKKYVYALQILVYNINYVNINIYMEIFSKNILCLYLYINNKYVQYTHVLCKHKSFLLDVINRD